VWLAFANGVPVIVTRAGTLADQVRDDTDGLVCEPEDEDDLLSALMRISAPGEAARLRSAVRAADPDSHWDAYLEALLSFAVPPAREPPGLEGLEPMTR
jgi:glycosyltransferase involved in cell wall biosynthesis